MNYENTLAELDKTVKKLEDGSTTLEEGVALFEKGVELTKQCLAALNEYKSKISSIRAEADKLLEDMD